MNRFYKMEVSVKYRQGKVLSVSFAHFTHDVYSSFLSPLLPLLIEKFGIGLSVASILSLLQRIPSLFSVAIGVVAHRLPWRGIILVAPLVTATAGSLMGLAPSVLVLGILLFTIGVSSATFHVPAPVMIKDYSGPKAGLGMSFYMLGGELARMVGPLLVVSAVSLWGLEGIWRLIFPAIGATLLLSVFIEKKPHENLAKTKSDSAGWKATMKQYSSFFIVMGIFLLLRAFVKSSLATFLPTYIGEKGGTLMAGAVSLSILQIAGAAGSFIGGGISDKLGRFNTLLLVTVFSPVLMLLFVYAGSSYRIVLLVLLGLTLYSSTPVLLAMVQEQGSSRPALMNAGFTTINFVSGAIAVLGTGFLGDIFGLDKTYLIGAYLAFGSIPVLFWLKHFVK